MILETHLAAFVSFANVVYIPFAMVMVFTRHNGIHATGFAFKCSCGGRISSTALDLVYEDVNLSVSKRQKTKDKAHGLDLKTKLVTLFPSTGSVKLFIAIITTNRSSFNFTTKETFLFR